MKKILLMLMLFLGFGSITIMGQTSVRIYPKASFVGVTKKGTTYAKQSIEKDPKRFFVGYDATTSTYGRGYLEFDLSPLPKDATIVSVSLQLTNALTTPLESNFNGKIKLYSCANYMDANETIWNSLKGFSGLELANVEIGSGGGKAVSSDPLNIVTKNAMGTKLYMAINHADESKITRFLGDNNSLYLDIKYGSSPTEENEGWTIEGPDVVYSGDIIDYYSPSPEISCYSVDFSVGWTYDHDIFEILAINSIGCSKNNSVRLKVKDTNAETKTTKIKTKTVEHFDGKKYDWPSGSKVVTVKYKPKKLILTPSSSVISLNSTVTYTLTGIASFATGYNVKWEAGNNMSLISAQGATTATFKSTGYGYGTVKAVLTYDEKSYIIENSSVQVINPDAPVITTDFSKFFAGNHYSAYLFDTVPGYTYSWNISGATIISSTDNSIYFKVGNFTMDASVLITVTTQSGKRISKSIPVKGLGGGGGVYPEI